DGVALLDPLAERSRLAIDVMTHEETGLAVEALDEERTVVVVALVGEDHSDLSLVEVGIDVDGETEVAGDLLGAQEQSALRLCRGKADDSIGDGPPSLPQRLLGRGEPLGQDGLGRVRARLPQRLPGALACRAESLGPHGEDHGAHSRERDRYPWQFFLE